MPLRLAGLLSVIVVMLGTLLGAPLAAYAGETTSPTPSSPAATASPSTGASDGAGTPTEELPDRYVQVTLLNSAQKTAAGTGTPIPGVTIEVTDPDGGEVGSADTDADGVAIIALPQGGKYTVTLDEDTLPDGISIADGTRTELEVTSILEGATRINFPIGVTYGETEGFGDRFTTALVSGVKFGIIVALAALGLSLVFGTTGLTNFAHGELITLGGIATYVLNRGLGLPVIVAGIGAVLVGALFGWLQDTVLWRPLRRRGTGLIAMMIVSIGLGVFLRSTYQYWFTSSTRTLSQYTTQERIDLGVVQLAPKEIAIMGVGVVAIAVVCVALMKTRLGKAMRAVADNPALASSSGMKVDGVISRVWILGTAMSALAGVLLAVNSQVNFAMGQKLLLLVFAAVTLGGLGTIWGAVAGSMIIGIMVEVGPLFGVPSSIKEVGALVVLILILLVRPQGILGRRERIG